MTGREGRSPPGAGVPWTGAICAASEQVLQPQSEWHQPGTVGLSSRAGLPLCAPLVTQSCPVLARAVTLSRLVPGPEESTGPPVRPPGYVADEQAWGKAAGLGRLCHTVPQSIVLEVWHTEGTQ